ncbi:FxSxx-COOH system tetratricopeptide repeat protein [Streptomyces sp. NBC_01477]|uniref:FxSxx-COOH system tetratricopeptide repeat protein n=1 Tax=Streptomyces sp. NBC_01477 TaxID=2976015 RepID=UPI002E33DAF0|nr:FxSxx-COOH system tetratricopeptide repeat protein [Streptomyces sp. NBC_01477]
MTHEADTGPPYTRVTLFHSSTENIGRTTALLHTARWMAAEGRRVLIVETPATVSRTERQLRSLLGAEAMPPPDALFSVVPAAGSPNGRQPSWPQPVTWAMSLGDEVVELAVLALPDTDLSARLPTYEEAADSTVYAGFDHVLVNAPTAQGTLRIGDLAPLAHAAAVCFAPDSASIGRAAWVARDLRERATGRPVDVIAVGLQVDSGLNEQLRMIRSLVRTAFREPGQEGVVPPYVEIPYDPLFLHSVSSPRDSSGTAQGLRKPVMARQSGYAQLAEAVIRPQTSVVRRVAIVYPPRHPAWAHWLGAQLSGAGVPSALVPFAQFSGERPDRDGMLLVLSPVGANAEQLGLVSRLSHPNVRIVLVDDEPLPSRIGHHEQIDLRACGEPEAVALVRRAVRLPAPAPARVSSPRFPRLPAVHNLAPRNPGFTGRDDLCEKMRESLAREAGSRRPCALTGPPGIGKSALALEFCHRFGGSYDAVWWLRATDSPDVARGLGRLAERSGRPTQDTDMRDVLDWLGSPDSGSWLLVYDDVTTSAALAELLPAVGEDRHILLTSRQQPLADAAVLEVPALTPMESRSLLLAAVPGLDETRADQVGQIMGREPLTVTLAGAWIDVDAGRREARNQPRADALAEAAEKLVSTFSAGQQDLLARYASVPLSRVMLEATLDELRVTAGGELWARKESGSDSLVWLLECCALLTPSGAELGLLRSRTLWKALSDRFSSPSGSAPWTDPLGDQLMIDVALRTLARHGLLEMHFGYPDRAIRQNRALRELVLDRLEPAERKEREREVRAMVAEYALVDPGSGTGGRTGAALIDARTRRLMSLKLWDDERPEVRQAVVEHTLRLARSDGRRHWYEALEIGRRAAESWDSSQPSSEYARLHNATAQAHRRLGESSQAGRDALIALRDHRRFLGVSHPRALLSADSYAAILRMEGSFDEARIEERGVLDSMTRVLGPDHRTTQQAEYNLALSEVLCGDYQSALELLQSRYGRRTAIGGQLDGWALGLLDTMALAHRGLGHNRESTDLLKQYLRRANDRARDDALSAEIGLAVGERRLGQSKQALERDRRVFGECRTRFGAGYAHTWRCQFSLAADLNAESEHRAAVDEIEACARTLEAVFGDDHPYTQLARVRTGVHRRNLGDHGNALDIGQESLTELARGLGPAHPWVAAAAVAVAGTLVAMRQYDEAEDKESFALLTLDELGLARHPAHALVKGNLGAIALLKGSGGPPDGTPHQDIDVELPTV